jgi:hypothetical protein
VGVVLGRLQRLWHQYVKGHTITYHQPLRPDEVIRGDEGSPLINVYEQDTFQRPDAHYECSCGETWSR